MQTVESITKGHPDKVADQISDAILDAYLTQDPNSRVAIETMVTGANLIIAGEVRSKADISPKDREHIGRRVLQHLGYADDLQNVHDFVVAQSPQIAAAVDADSLGAGDQGIMYGYAINWTPERLPLAQVAARDLTDMLTRLRETGELPWLRADGKSQVTLDWDKPTTVVVSTLHDETVDLQEVRAQLQPHIEESLQNSEVYGESRILINPAGAWTHGGPIADTGLTGRKIMVDSYGGLAPHGGGAFSGKDPSKVDRSAAYAARQATKWLVDEGLTGEATVSLAYAIGVDEPVMVNVKGGGYTADCKLQKILRETFDFRPAAIIERLDLNRPIYERTARDGHFGRGDYPWEQTCL